MRRVAYIMSAIAVSSSAFAAGFGSHRTELIRASWTCMNPHQIEIVKEVPMGQTKDREKETGWERDIGVLREHTDVIVLSDEAGTAQVAVVRPGVPGQGHDEYNGWHGQFRMDQPRTDQFGQDRTAHQHIWRRGPDLDGTGRGPVLDLLQAGGSVRLGSLASACGYRYRTVRAGLAAMRRCSAERLS